MIKHMSTQLEHSALAASFDNLLTILTKLSMFLSVAALFLLFFSYVFEVLMRYIFSMPTTWTFDLGKAFLSISVIMALPDITRTGSNIAIDVVLAKFTPAIEHQIRRLIGLICGIVCMTTAWIFLNETLRQASADIMTFWTHPVPKWWISIFIPFGFALSSLHFLRIALVAKHQSSQKQET